MPRRRSKGKTGPSKPRSVDRTESKIKKWNKVSDVPPDEEDEFHNSRDQILLEGDYEGADEDGDDDEVFVLNGISDEEEDEEMEFEDGSEDDKPASTRKTKKEAKAKKRVRSESEESVSEEEGWGRGRGAYYSSNAAQLDSDDDEAHDLEEREAIRLQAKARNELDEEDFGFNDILEMDTSTEVFEEQSLSTDPKVLLKHLEKTDPESFALARDWADTVYNLSRVREKLSELEDDEADYVRLGMAHLYYQALLCYTSNLAFYLHLRADEKYTRHPELLKSHPILKRLLTLKQSLITLEEFGVMESDVDSDDSDEDEDEEMDDAEMLWSGDLEEGELRALLSDALATEEAAVSGLKPKAKRIKSALTDSIPDSPPKKKRKADRGPTFNLVEPEFVPSKSSSSQHRDKAIDVFGEATSLDYVDAADKRAQQKSLRFLTSKIESADARRKGARSNALGGDDDIPYRERRKEKEARLAKEAQARVRKQGGADLDDVNPEPNNNKEDSSGDSNDEGEGYYELIKHVSKEKKEKKKADYEAARVAERNFEDENVSGPRSLTRTILANKGLTPHRSKSVRNPRVKKRQKFETAKKKLSSQKPVYKGGLSQSRGVYEGERSGISRVVKSVRLS